MAKIALLIGVSQYDSGDLTPLPAAEKDVAAIATVLRDPDLGNFDQVQDLLNPDLIQLQDTIATLFDDCQRDDLVLLYFSGHGVTDEFGNFFFTNRITRKSKQGGLNTGTATRANFVHDLMDRCNSDRQVIVLDCCHSGAFPTGMMARDAGGTIDFERQLGGRGRIVLTSSAATEYSFERQGEELAVYTRYLVEGIRTGAADLDGDGAISVNELHDYVREQVRKAAPAMKPERYVFQEGDRILLAKAPIGDPKQEFRKLVQTYSQDGIIRPAGKSVLERRRLSLGLTTEDANAIIAEVLRPYIEHRENLREYEEVLQAEIELEFPLGERAQQELRALQRELNLTDENVAEIAQRLFPIASPTPSLPSTPPPTPTPTLPTFTFDIITVDDRGQEIDRRPGQATYFVEDLGNGVTLEMVKVPAGEFLMGTAEAERNTIIQEMTRYDISQEDAEQWTGWEMPQHRVKVPEFWMGKYAVTQVQYEALMGNNPAEFKGANRPVEQVSWDEAVAFCNRLFQRTGKLYRLPSESEWEYACRAGTSTPFAFGTTITPALVNYDGSYPYGNAPKGTYRGETTGVGSFLPNAFGLYDMHGNVWEWCADPWHENYKGAPGDGSVWTSNGDNQRYVVRGGSWLYPSFGCRAAFRAPDARAGRYEYDGFRVVCGWVPGL